MSVTPDFILNRLNFYFVLPFFVVCQRKRTASGETKGCSDPTDSSKNVVQVPPINFLWHAEVRHSKVGHIRDILGALSARPGCFNQGCVVKLEHRKAKGDTNSEGNEGRFDIVLCRQSTSLLKSFIQNDTEWRNMLSFIFMV